MTILGTAMNGITVYDATSIGGHVHPTIQGIISEVIGKVTLEGTFVRTTVDMGRVIGRDHLVVTMPGDRVCYYKRGNRAGFSRMVLKNADYTQMVTIILCVATEGEFDGQWVVVTAFEGMPGEREPWDASIQDKPELLALSKAFWSTHALVPTEAEMDDIMTSTLRWETVQ